jgi:hypothetical protein
MTRPELDALPEWGPGTVAVLSTGAGPPHAIPVSTATRTGPRTIVLALALRRESLARLRADPRCALTLLAGGDVAFTARGAAAIAEEPMAASDRVAAVRIDVETIQDHRHDDFEIDGGVRWHWTDAAAERRDGAIRAALGPGEPLHVRPLGAGESDWVRAMMRERWGDEIVAGRGRVWRPAELPGIVAVGGSGERAGLATYAVEGDAAELVTIDALRPGAGRLLLEAVADAARAAGAGRLLVMTTNDNLGALRFYQRAGFRLAALRPGAVDEARSLKPAIAATGADGIPIRDELDLVLELGGPRQVPGGR